MLKVISFGILLGALAAFATCVRGLERSCGGDCFLSDDCSEDVNCRCSYFHCTTIPEGACGGGCVSDYQCRAWAEGDESCRCGPLFDCMNTKEAETPEFQKFAKFMLSIRGSHYQRKVQEMQRLYQDQEAALL